MTECSRFYKYFINYLFWFFCNSAPNVIQSIEKKMYPSIKKKQIKGKESHKRISWELNSLSRVIEQLKFNYSKLTGFMRLARKKKPRKTINVLFATIKKT